jgi:hypothetical protein
MVEAMSAKAVTESFLIVASCLRKRTPAIVAE